MRRTQGWEKRLWAVTRKSMAKPFAWGENDCCLFAADCILAQTGEDLAAEFRGAYNSEASAKRLLASMDCRDVGDVAARYLPEIAVSLARRGDIVMIEGIHGFFLAVVDGHTAVGPTQEGQSHSQVSQAVKAWRVG